MHTLGFWSRPESGWQSVTRQGEFVDAIAMILAKKSSARGCDLLRSVTDSVLPMLSIVACPEALLFSRYVFYSPTA